MLKDVTHIVTDGLLGSGTEKSDGLSIKIGVSPVVSTAPVVITGDMDAARIREKLGLSPLADAVMDSVQFGANRIFCFPVAATTPGTLGEVTKSGEGGGSVTVTGSPVNAFSIVIRITAQGGLNTAAFAISINGGYSFTDEITVPMAGSYEPEGTGLTVKFTDAAQEDQKAQSFLVGDSYTFTTTAPAMTNGDVLAAIDKLQSFHQECEFAHIVGESALPLWQAVSEAQKELAEVFHKPMLFIIEAGFPDDSDGDLADWLLQMEADRKKVRNSDLQVVAAWGRLVKLDGTTQAINLAGVVSGLYARAPVQVSIGKTRPEAGFGISRDRLPELLPAGMDNSAIERLDLAGYLTFREYDGLSDIYVYHANMLCPDGSDYSYAEDTRVKNKIIRQTRKEALLLLNDDIDLENVQGELETKAKFMFPPLQDMIDAKEISAAEITVPEGQEQTILKDGKLRVKIRYLSRGYIREIEVDLGRSQP